MKKRTEGGQFNKVEVREYDLLEGLEALNGQSYPTIIKKIAQIRKTAEQILADHGEPTEAKTTWTRDDGAEMTGFLDNYIRDRYPGDTRKDQIVKLSAQIIMDAHRLEKAESKETIAECAFQLGQRAAFARAYQMQDGGSGKKKPSRRKAWAENLAEQLHYLSDNELFWELADNDGLQVDDGEGRYDILPMNDDEVIKAVPLDDDSPQQNIKFNSFLKRYVTPARKKSKVS